MYQLMDFLIRGGVPVLIVGGFFLFLLYSYIRQMRAQALYVPPLDLVDAKKLDDMVARQVEEYLRPLLVSKGYTDKEISQILKRTSPGGGKFRR